MRSRNWCFTLNNPQEDELTTTDPPTLPQFDLQLYRVYQLEQGTKETKHFQGYVHFRNPRSLSQVRKCLPRAHWETAKGNAQQNTDYCTKMDTRIGEPIIEGSMPTQGKRTDLNEAAKLAKIRAYKDIEPALYIRYHKGLQAYTLLHQTHRNTAPTTIWLYGTTGTGKSKLAYELGGINDCEVYFKPAGPWWDGYYQQGVVVIDDIRQEDYPYQSLLQWLDRYPCMVPVKGGFAKLNSATFVITAPSTPEWTYASQTNDVNGIGQLNRRINLQLELTNVT